MSNQDQNNIQNESADSSHLQKIPLENINKILAKQTVHPVDLRKIKNSDVKSIYSREYEESQYFIQNPKMTQVINERTNYYSFF